MTSSRTSRPLRRLAVVGSGGGPAVRFVHASREHALETGDDVTTIALHAAADRHAMFVRDADITHELATGDQAELEQALVDVGADAVWVGDGAAVDIAALAETCDRMGLVVIGPPAAVLRRLADGITSRQIAEACSVPVAPWSAGPVETVEEAQRHAERIGFPVAVAAWNGADRRRVDHADDLPAALDAVRAGVRRATGDDRVLLERWITGARSIEVQIVADEAGTVWPLGVRDCTVRRGSRPLLEESPPPALDIVQGAELQESAVRLGGAVGHRGIGTVRFLFDPVEGAHVFVGMDDVSVDHPATEAVTGIDLVELQLHVAAGGLLEGPPPQADGHAVHARIVAEDPEDGFAPAPGRVEVLRLPSGAGIRVDTEVEEGDWTRPGPASVIAGITATGASRAEATARLRGALERTEIVVRDGATDTAFVRDVLGTEDWLRASTDTEWVDRLVESGSVAARLGEIALLVAAIDVHRTERAVEIAAFRESARRGRPEIPLTLGRRVELRYHGHLFPLDVRRLGPGDYRITVDGHPIAVRREEIGRARTVLTVGGRRHRVVSAVHGVTHVVEVDGQPHRFVHDEGGVVRSPAPAVVVSIDVEPGDPVEVGQRLAVLEAMKMETAVHAEYPGTVERIEVRHNDQVGTGDTLLVVQPHLQPSAGTGSPTLDFAPIAAVDEVDHDRCRHWMHAVRNLLLGYDLEPADVMRLARPDAGPCGDRMDDETYRRMEEDALSIFADVLSLFGREADDEDEPLLRHGTEGYLFEYLRRVEARAADLPASFVARLERTLARFGVESLDPSPDLDTALARIVRSHLRMNGQIRAVLQLLERRLERPLTHSSSSPGGDARRALLEDVARSTRADHPAVHDLVREVIHREFEAPFLAERRWMALEEAEGHLDALTTVHDPDQRAGHIESLVECPQPLTAMLAWRFVDGSPRLRAGLLEVMTRRYYRIRDLTGLSSTTVDGVTVVSGGYRLDERRVRVLATHVELDELAAGVQVIDRMLSEPVPDDDAGHTDVVLDVYLWSAIPVGDDALDDIHATIDATLGGRRLHRIAVALAQPTDDPAAPRTAKSQTSFLTLRPTDGDRYAVDPASHGLHPMIAKRLELWRLDEFDVQRLPATDGVHLFHGIAHDNPRDERLFALAEVRDLTGVYSGDGRLLRLPELERVVSETTGAMRRFQAQRPPGKRLGWNRILLSLWPQLDLTQAEITGMIERLAPEAEGLGLQKVQVLARIRTSEDAVELRVLELTDPVGNDPRVTIRPRSDRRIRPLGRHEQNVVRLRQRGLIDPYELLRTVAPAPDTARRDIPAGSYQEYDLVGDPSPDDPDGAPTLVPVDREPGLNSANIVIALVENRTERHPDGMRRVTIVGDPSRGMGNLAEAECRRINAALDLAEELGVPADWFAVSAGAKIAMDSGSENMDWISATLRRIIEFTQAGHHLNVVVTGISVGAQPYWNAEATMLMHTKGVLIMVPTSAMVLTGKDALDYSGGVSAENNLGIGGYERVMGPNGQAQYLAHDVVDACRLLLRHHQFAWSPPGERFPPPWTTTDPSDRDILSMPHGGEFPTLAELFSEASNPGRKKPFEMRRVMEAVVDSDVPTMERWFGMADAEIPIVWNASIGGHSVCLLGFEAKNLARPGIVPADGPARWTSSTLFPKGSKKVARAVNAASGNRPLVVLASLSGFDGSPESMRTWQLEFGAEIGRAVVNFDGPIVFVVVSRYHGGAFVVFSAALNDSMEVAALEGSHASVIGGAPAAAVVFAREVDQRTDADPRVEAGRAAVASATTGDRARLAAELALLREQVRADKLGEVAAEFDGIHDVHRALAVGSIDRIVPPAQLRRYLVEALDRGVERTLAAMR